MMTLLDELRDDPRGLGYAPLVSAGDAVSLVALLNATDGPGAGAVPATRMTRGALLIRIVPILDQLASGLTLSGAAIAPQVDRRWSQRFDALRGGDAEIDMTPALVGMLQQAVADGLASAEYIASIGQRIGSRADVLGLGSLSPDDVSRALGAMEV